ncbi:hypothetical protein IEQ34_025150 [Dendrobium chrysotoxum]|uniref:CR-type domain-containing protein n=1 Tax=Dendrobium chrysotoxum TaxID=161865 RepID=A0AAV7FQP1_DENCH|nr:hypothetical protein IEQ34_025150 [Dendrobium chrysotoxum]
MSEAYQVLSDAEQRSGYDRFGEEGLKRLIRQVNREAVVVGAVIRLTYSVTSSVAVAASDSRLAHITFDRTAVCPKCDGSGARSRADIVSCTTCNGQGVRIVRQQIMPGFVTNAQMTCDKCGGKGKTIAHACERCGGAKVVKENAELDVEVVPGARGRGVIFEGESDESPDYEARRRDIKLMSERKRAGFRRRDTNLYTTLHSFWTKHCWDSNATSPISTITWSPSVAEEASPSPASFIESRVRYAQTGRLGFVRRSVRRVQRGVPRQGRGRSSQCSRKGLWTSTGRHGQRTWQRKGLQFRRVVTSYCSPVPVPLSHN